MIRAFRCDDLDTPHAYVSIKTAFDQKWPCKAKNGPERHSLLGPQRMPKRFGSVSKGIILMKSNQAEGFVAVLGIHGVPWGAQELFSQLVSVLGQMGHFRPPMST